MRDHARGCSESKPFSELDFQEKKEVIIKGRPTISMETERLLKLRDDKEPRSKERKRSTYFYKQTLKLLFRRSAA